MVTPVPLQPAPPQVPQPQPVASVVAQSGVMAPPSPMLAGSRQSSPPKPLGSPKVSPVRVTASPVRSSKAPSAACDPTVPAEAAAVAVAAAAAAAAAVVPDAAAPPEPPQSKRGRKRSNARAPDGNEGGALPRRGRPPNSARAGRGPAALDDSTTIVGAPVPSVACPDPPPSKQRARRTGAKVRAVLPGAEQPQWLEVVAPDARLQLSTSAAASTAAGDATAAAASAASVATKAAGVTNARPKAAAADVVRSIALPLPLLPLAYVP